MKVISTQLSAVSFEKITAKEAANDSSISY
jgi:hypothetical protein